ncbi:MAG: diphosphate--fructose-6-phosphate 1-phosphotransferase [Acidobacteriota bacterium]
MMERNILVVQAGGPTQVLNATLASIVEEARGSGAFLRILGARSAMRGLAKGQVADLTGLSAQDLRVLRSTPGAALGASRYPLKAEDLTAILQHLERLRVSDVLAIGGNGTMHAAGLLADRARKAGRLIRIVGVPKTVDNDLERTDRSPGYASAARYIAQVTCDLAADVRSMPQPVSILETMGRSVGWLAAAAAATKQDEAEAPHVVLLPERPFVLDRFLGQVDECVTRRGWCVVVAAEGLRDPQGRMVYEVEDPAQADPLKRSITGGVAQYLADRVAQHLKLRCRSEKPGLLGRSSMQHVASQDREDAELVGRAGVRALLEGGSERMVSLRSLRSTETSGYDLVPLIEVAGIERPIPGEWIRDGDVPLGAPFFQYIRPLIGQLGSHPQITLPDYPPRFRETASEEERKHVIKF